MIAPSLEDFLAQAAGASRTHVWLDLTADLETPLSVYWKLAHDETNSFLLESVSGGEQLARYSILGIRPRVTVRSKGSVVTKVKGEQTTTHSLALGQTPLDILKEETLTCPPVPGLPKFCGGAVGFLAYDIVRFIERLGDGPMDDIGCNDMAMMVTDSVVVFDHAKNIIRIITTADITATGYEQATATIRSLAERIESPLPPLPPKVTGNTTVTSNTTEESFHRSVVAVQDHIANGDCIQVVLSQRFETPCAAHPVTIYRALRSLNPSPYMFLLRFDDCDLVGASPELLVSLNGRTARVRPIAGTRWRGTDPAEDLRLAEELIADEKERAEHIMLVDLGRNDLGRVSQFGSVKVGQLMEIERYSHVMHIVSDVTGDLSPEQDGFDLIKATFPAGTVSGAPKVKAMQLIDSLETTKRGVYAGAVGYVGDSGDLDLAIAIRTIFLKNQRAYVQAGAGIVYDSNPASEYAETWNKAKACLRAIEIAQS